MCGFRAKSTLLSLSLLYGGKFRCVIMVLLCTNFIHSQPIIPNSIYASHRQKTEVSDQRSNTSMTNSDSILWWRRVNGLKIPPPQQLFEKNISTGDPFICPSPFMKTFSLTLFWSALHALIAYTHTSRPHPSGDNFATAGSGIIN